MSKQDRQGVRTPADIERKYDLGAESTAISVATDARRMAERASLAVDSLDRSLDQNEIISRLTGDTGIIKSADGTVQVDLTNNKVIINTLISGVSGKFVLSADGLIGYTVAEDGTSTQKLVIDPSGKIGGKTISWKANDDGTYSLIGS